MTYTKFPCPDAATQAKIDRLPKLNPEAKKRWVDALLSGKYKQGRSRLRTEDHGFCCLGVACDVFKGDVNADWVGRAGTQIMGEIVYLPPSIASILGGQVCAKDYHVYYKGQCTPLSILNDSNVSFEMIAGLIINQL